MAVTAGPGTGTTEAAAARLGPVREGDTAGAGGPPGAAPRWRRAAVPALVVAVYAVLSLALYWPVQPLSTTHLLTCGCSDPALDTWFIAWTPHALVDHVNPLFTTTVEYPFGFNLAANTWMPLLGLLGAPLTLTIGPVAAVNLLFRLAFVCSATAMYYVLRRLRTTRRAAFVGGLLYGFSPYMIGQGSFHLNLVFVPLPPLILLAVYELVTGKRSPTRVGLVLGLLCAAQYLISSEVLADTALLAVLAVALAGAMHPRAARLRSPRVARGVLAAAVPFAAVCAYPILFQFSGRQHLALTHAFGNLENINSDLLSAIVPTRHELVGPAALLARGSSYAGGDLPENGGYLGLGLLAVLGAILVVRRRQPLVRWCLFLALVAYAFSLGRTLHVDNHVTHVPMPFDVLWKLPVLSSELPARYSLLVALFCSVALAVGLDPPARRLTGRAGAATGGAATARADPAGVATAGAVPAPRAGRTPASGAGRTAGSGQAMRRAMSRDSLRFAALVAVALVPLLPRFGYSQPPTRAPAAFLDSATARAIPAGSVVLTYPWNAPPHNDALLWQAEAGIRFKLIGGYGVAPNPLDVDYPLIPPPVTMYDLFEAAWGDRIAYPPLDRSTIGAMRVFCLYWQVSTILVVPLHGQVRRLLRYLDAAFGRGRRVEGVDVWTGVQARARAALPPAHARVPA